MTDRHTRHHCVVCQSEIPPMTRTEAFEKGAAFELNGKTYYRCAGGRHTTQECLQVIGAIPTFSRAKKAAAP